MNKFGPLILAVVFMTTRARAAVLETSPSTSTKPPLTTSQRVVSTDITSTSTPFSGGSFLATIDDQWALRRGIRFDATCTFAVTMNEGPEMSSFIVDFGTTVYNFQQWVGNVVSPNGTTGSVFNLTNKFDLVPPSISLSFQATVNARQVPNITCRSQHHQYVPTTTTVSARITPTTPNLRSIRIQELSDWSEGRSRRFSGRCSFDITEEYDFGELKINVTFEEPTFNFLDWSWDHISNAEDGFWYFRSNRWHLAPGHVNFDFHVSHGFRGPLVGHCHVQTASGLSTTSHSTTSPLRVIN